MTDGSAMRLHVVRTGCPHPAPERYGSSFKKERAIAEVARTYAGAVLFPDELTTVDLSK